MAPKIAISGSGGFIGSHLVSRLLTDGFDLVTFDHGKPAYGEDFYKFRRSTSRHSLLMDTNEMALDLAKETTSSIANSISDCSMFIHLAAYPGVRQSMERPENYSRNNLMAFTNVLEACRLAEIPKLLYASSSSVYGDRGKNIRMSEDLADGSGLASYYAGTKWSNEILAKQYPFTKTQCTALRFFTVYGPWGRPDMAYYSFARAIRDDIEITLYDNGKPMRDFTYIDDLTDRLNQLVSVLDTTDISAPTSLNFGLGVPLSAGSLLHSLETHLGKKAKVVNVQRPSADVESTFSDPTLLNSLVGDLESTSLDDGIAKFAEWFKEYEFVN